MNIKITLGKVTRQYIACETNAPEAYDGHGTFTLRKIADTHRIILVRAENFDWQEGRNGSGMKTLTRVEDTSSMRLVIENWLYERLVGGTDV